MTAEELIRMCKCALEAPIETASCAYDSIFREIIERSEKFRWHDLRKNPEDLPETEDSVLVATKYGNQMFSAYKGWWNPISNKMVTDSKQWDLPQYYCSTDIIAWRYIEPFEVSE